MHNQAGFCSIEMWRRLLGMALVVAVLVSQGLGLLHRYVHLSGDSRHIGLVGHPVSAEPRQQALLSANHVPHAAAWVSGLFSAHTEGSAACLGFDACIDSVPTEGQLGFVAMPAIGFLLQLNGLAIARWHAQFQARGPPISH